jgi:hypothetical protein
MRAWKKGALYGFLFPLLWLSFGMLIRGIVGMFSVLRTETLGGAIDAFFMLPIVPGVIIQQRLGTTVISHFFTTMFFWALVGAMTGYLIDKRTSSSG